MPRSGASSPEPAAAPGIPAIVEGLAGNRHIPPAGRPGLWVDPIELAVDAPLGVVVGIPALDPRSTATPRQALEALVRTALRRPPCVVTFSGGRDSSTVLAVAAQVARREGLPLPIAATHRFPGLTETDESDWQEQIVAHLELPDWHRFTWTDELDVVGPYARRVLRSTGIGSPFNQHFFLPMIDLARGGSVLTGAGGDELFTIPMRRIANRVLHDRNTRRWRDARGFAAQMLPAPLRVQRARRASPLDVAWLRPSAQRQLNARAAASLERVPVRFDTAVRRWWWPARAAQSAREQVRRLGAAHDVAVEHPFMSRAFLSAFAARHGATVPPGRARGLREICGTLLPDTLYSRTSKASFDGAFLSTHAQSFVEGWTGRGLDDAVIDVEQLRSTWRSGDFDARSMLLLQAAWSAEHGLE